MEAYLRVFINWNQNNQARHLQMAEFTYNNTKNASISHMPFKLNCCYHPQVFFEDNIYPCSRSCSANKLVKKLKELMNICQQNLFHAQELQKRAHNKSIKPRYYTSGEKIWFNSKYIKTKQHPKFKAKFFGFFKSYIQLKNKHTNQIFSPNRKSTMFFICYYQSRTLLRKIR